MPPDPLSPRTMLLGKFITFCGKFHPLLDSIYLHCLIATKKDAIERDL